MASCDSALRTPSGSSLCTCNACHSVLAVVQIQADKDAVKKAKADAKAAEKASAKQAKASEKAAEKEAKQTAKRGKKGKKVSGCT